MNIESSVKLLTQDSSLINKKNDSTSPMTEVQLPHASILVWFKKITCLSPTVIIKSQLILNYDLVHSNIQVNGNIGSNF